MIRNVKKLAYLSVGLTKNLYLRFSLNQNQQNQEKNIVFSNEFHQKAYLASEIMKRIQKPIHSIREKSLKNQIRDFLKSVTATKNSKKQFYDIFDNGIKINTEIFDQSRIFQASYNSLTTFHPTKIITGQIFSKINRDAKQKLFICHFGISKTFSTILYQKLSNFIIDYKMRTKPQDISKDILNAKRLFYWTLQLQHTEQFVNNLIKNQLLDSQKQYFHQKKSFQQNWKCLLQAYKKRQIKNSLTIDQFNALIAEIRKTGYTKQQSESTEEKFQKIISIQKIIKQKINQNFYIIYQSSINIEQYLLTQLFLVKEPSHNRQVPLYSPIHFQSKFKNQLNRIEMIDYFIDVYDSFFKNSIDQFVSNENNPLYPQKQKFYKSLRQQLFEIWRKQKSFYVNQLVIHQYISKIQYEDIDSSVDFGFSSSSQTLQVLKKRLIALFRQLIQIRMPQMLQLKVQNFLHKASQNYMQKIFFFTQLYSKFLNLKDKEEKAVNQLKIKQKQITLLPDKKKYEQLINALDQHLFAIQNDEISLIIPPEVLFKLQINTEKRKNIIKKVKLLQYIAWEIASFIGTSYSNHMNQAAKGIAIENIIKIILTQGESSLKIFNNSGKFQVQQFTKIKQNIGTFNVFQSQKRNKSNQIFDFIQNVRGKMSQIIKESKNDNLEVVNQLFLPVVKDTATNDFDTVISLKKSIHQSSKAIDFILVQYNKEYKKFSFYAFDVTIDQRILVIQEKIEKFLQSYEYMANKNQKQITIDNEDYKIQLCYYTMTPQNDYKNVSAYISQSLNKQAFKKYNFNKVSYNPTDLNDIVKFSPTNRQNDYFLHQIGHLSLSNNIKITNENQSNIVNFSLLNMLLQTDQSKIAN